MIAKSKRDNGRFALIDALRGIAAMAVVLFHAEAGGHVPLIGAALPGAAAVAKQGYLGVAIFFALSGFVIAHALGAAPMSRQRFVSFTIRRAIRLDPPYWFAIALTIGFSLLASKVVSGRPAESFSVPQVAIHLVYLQDILHVAPIGAVFWTLCLEIQFYLAYAASLAAFHAVPTGRGRGVVVLGVVALSLLWPLGIAPEAPAGLFLPHWHDFLLGAGAYWALRLPEFGRAFGVYAAVLLVGALATDDHFTLVCACTSVLLYTAGRTSALADGLNWRWLQRLGLVSYSLYLVHNPLTGASFRIGYAITGHSALTETFWLVGSVGVCIGAAMVVYWAVERPSMALARRIDLTKGEEGNGSPNVLKAFFAPANRG